MLEIESIHCPLDFSEGSLEALAQTTDITIKFGADIYLIHVLPILPALPNDPTLVFQVPEYERSPRANAQKRLNDIASELNEKGIHTRTLVGHGDAAVAIVRIAEQQGISLIVIATFGRTGCRRFVRFRHGKGSAAR
jgi:nucleotide-binding universal stress UspA family protein